MSTEPRTTEWTTLLAPGVEEVVPVDISYVQWGLMFGGQIDAGSLALALLQHVVELYVDDRVVLTAPAYRVPAWGIGLLPTSEARRHDPRELLAPLVCLRGSRLLFRFVQCAGTPFECTPALVLEGQ